MRYRRVVVTRFGGPESLQVIEEASLPEPGPGEVRIRVLVAGVAFTDVWIRNGTYPDLKVKREFGPGYDMVGAVDGLGEGVTHREVGQRVAGLTVIGACSEYLCVPATGLTVVPAGLDTAEAVCVVLPYVTAYQMLHRMAEVKPGQRILIHGAGGAVGTAMLQLGKLLGLEMYGTASGPRHELVRRLGATPIDYRSEDFVKRVLSLAGTGVDAAFDPIGGDNFRKSFNVLRKGGKLVAYGFYNAALGNGGSIPLDFMRLQLWNYWPNGRSAAFYSIGALQQKHPDWFSTDLANLFELLARKAIQPIIAARLPLDDVRCAHELVEQSKVRGRIVLTVAEAPACRI